MQPEDLKSLGKELLKCDSSKDLKTLGKKLQDYDHSFFMLFDPVKPTKEMSTRDIGRFVKENKNRLNSNELRKKVILNITIKTAIKDWLSTIENQGTKQKYKRAIKRIFELEPLKDALKKNCAITTLDKNWSGATGVYKLMEGIDAPESAIKICQSVYSRFCDFIRVATLGIIDPEESPRQKKDYYSTLNIYEETNWEEFISSMRTPFNLLTEMTFLAAKSCEFRLRLVNSRKNVLTLDTSQIDFENKTISFKAEQSYHVTDILGSPLCIPFPESFMDRLKNYLGGRRGVVFLSRKSKPLFAMQIQREFKKASKRLPYEITPVMLGWAGVLAYKQERDKKINFK